MPKRTELDEYIECLIEDNPENISRIGTKLWFKTHRTYNGKLYFWIDEKYMGKITPDETNYPNEKLRKEVKRALRKMPEGEHLLCEIKGIYSNLYYELRWIIEEDPLAQTFYAEFKANMELLKEIFAPFARENKKIIDEKQEEEGSVEIEEIKMPQKEESEISKLKKLTILDKIKFEDVNPKTKPDKKPLEKLCKEMEESNRMEKEIRKALQNIEHVKKEKKEEKKKLKEQIEKEKIVNEEKIEEKTTNKIEIKEQIANEEQEEKSIDNTPREGDKLWVTALKNKGNETYFRIGDKYQGKIHVDLINYPYTTPRTRIQRALRNMEVGQVVLCKIQRILPDFRVKLRWEIEEDPAAELLLTKYYKKGLRKKLNDFVRRKR
jgi:hypothetical protein